MYFCGRTDPQCRGALRSHVRQKILIAAYESGSFTMADLLVRAQVTKNDKMRMISFREFFIIARKKLGLTSAACTDDALRSCYKSLDSDGLIGRDDLANFLRGDRSNTSEVRSCLEPETRLALRQKDLREKQTLIHIRRKINRALSRIGLSADIVFDDGEWTPHDLLAFLSYRLNICTIQPSALFLLAKSLRRNNFSSGPYNKEEDSGMNAVKVSAEQIRRFLRHS